MKTFLTLALAASLGLVTTPALAQHARHAHADAGTAPVAAPQLQATLRGLWHAHVVHTRDYAFALKSANARDATRAEHEVVDNARQIAGAVAGFYGKAAGDRMFALLGGHWGAVKAMTDAKQHGDAAAHARAVESLTANAREIAVFLSGANPNLPQDAVFGLLAAHGAHHAMQIDQVMSGDLKGEKATWTAMQAHMDTIADAIAAALAKQFPDKAA